MTGDDAATAMSINENMRFFIESSLGNNNEFLAFSARFIQTPCSYWEIALRRFDNADPCLRTSAKELTKCAKFFYVVRWQWYCSASAQLPLGSHPTKCNGT